MLHKKLFSSIITVALATLVLAGCSNDPHLPENATDEQQIAYQYEVFIKTIGEIDSDAATAAFKAKTALPDDATDKQKKEVAAQIFALAPEGFGTILVNDLTEDEKMQVYGQLAIQSIMSSINTEPKTVEVPEKAVKVTGDEAEINVKKVTVKEGDKTVDNTYEFPIEFVKVDGEWLLVYLDGEETTEPVTDETTSDEAPAEDESFDPLLEK